MIGNSKGVLPPISSCVSFLGVYKATELTTNANHAYYFYKEDGFYKVAEIDTTDPIKAYVIIFMTMKIADNKKLTLTVKS